MIGWVVRPTRHIAFGLGKLDSFAFAYCTKGLDGTSILVFPLSPGLCTVYAVEALTIGTFVIGLYSST